MKRRKWLVGGLALVVLLLIGARWIGPELWARSWENKWQDFHSKWEARGEEFSAQAHLPPPVPDADNLARQPWVAKVIARDPKALETIEAMALAQIEGVDPANLPVGDDSLLNALSEDPDLKERLQSHLNKFRPQLDAFTAGVARPEFRWDYNIEAGIEAITPYPDLAAVGDAIKYSGILAIATADSARIANNAEALVRFGNHLRGEPFLVGFVTGGGADAVACSLINAAVDHDVLSAADRDRLAQALEAPRPTIGEALATGLRVERGIFLQLIEEMEQDAAEREGLPKSWQPDWAVLRVFFARNRLALCEDMQRHLLGSGGGVRKAIRIGDIPAYQASLEARYDEPSPYEAVAALSFGAGEASVNKMSRVEEERRRTIERLRE